VTARKLARPESATLGILGCSVQGRSNTDALNILFPLEVVFAYDIDPKIARAFAEDISKGIGLEVTVVESPREGVSGCDMVVTAGPILKVPHETIQAGWLDAGAFASLVDFDSYWHPAALKEVDRFCTDDHAQLQHYIQAGYFQNIPPVHADLGELVVGKKAGRETVSEWTMAANVGLAMDDMAVAPAIYQRALEKRIGRWLPR
jgi:ornithine cyclodeaminase/alanine dehydrogenase-like protein (mu-crystallin family)